MLDAELAAVAGSAHDLYAGGTSLTAKIGEVGFDDRGEQSHQRLGMLGHLRVVAVHLIKQDAGPGSEGSTALVVDLGLEEHAADVGVNQNVVSGLSWIADALQITSLAALSRPSEGVLVGNLGQTESHHPCS